MNNEPKLRLIDVSTRKYPGKFAIVDAEDYERLNVRKWSVDRDNGNYYARARINFKSVKMHRLVIGAESGQMVDHRDGNGLNNQKSNIRIATAKQNNTNRQITKSASGYRGVTRSRHNKWWVNIRIAGKTKFLGSFINLEDAARAYDAAAIKYHGEFAKLNFPTMVTK